MSLKIILLGFTCEHGPTALSEIGLNRLTLTRCQGTASPNRCSQIRRSCTYDRKPRRKPCADIIHESAHLRAHRGAILACSSQFDLWLRQLVRKEAFFPTS